MNKFLDLISRWYWDVEYKVRKYSSLLFAVIFGLFALLSIQYYQQLSQPITIDYANAAVDGLQIKMWTPDKIYIGEENQDKIEFEVTYDEKLESDNNDVIIDLSSNDDNLAFVKEPVKFKLDSADSSEKMTNIYYRRGNSFNPQIEIAADISVADQKITLSRSVAVAKAPQESLAFWSSIIAGILTALSLFDQIRKLWGKKE